MVLASLLWGLALHAKAQHDAPLTLLNATRRSEATALSTAQGERRLTVDCASVGLAEAVARGRARPRCLCIAGARSAHHANRRPTRPPRDRAAAPSQASRA